MEMNQNTGNTEETIMTTEISEENNLKSPSLQDTSVMNLYHQRLYLKLIELTYDEGINTTYKHIQGPVLQTWKP